MQKETLNDRRKKISGSLELQQKYVVSYVLTLKENTTRLISRFDTVPMRLNSTRFHSNTLISTLEFSKRNCTICPHTDFTCQSITRLTVIETTLCKHSTFLPLSAKMSFNLRSQSRPHSARDRLQLKWTKRERTSRLLSKRERNVRKNRERRRRNCYSPPSVRSVSALARLNEK